MYRARAGLDNRTTAWNASRLLDPALHGEAKRFLATIPVIGPLPDRTMTKVLELMEVHHHAAGEIVCAEDDPGHELFIVRSGTVEVTRKTPAGRSIRLARLGPSDCFGEMSLIGIQRRSASVTTCEESEILVLTNQALHAIWQHDAEGFTLLVMNIARELSRRLRAADATIADLLVRLDGYSLRSNLE